MDDVSPRTRVLLITQWFDPEPAFKGMPFAQELARHGFAVEVLTGFPNYPGGRVYPGHRIRPLLRTRSGEVDVTRVALYPSHDASRIGRFLNYGSFAFSALVYSLFFCRRPDVVYAYHPPLTVGVVAALVRMLRGVPVVYDIQDMWPDTLKATGMVANERVLRAVGRVCAWVYARVDRLAVLSPGFRRLLEARGVPGDRIEVVYNWCDEQSVRAPEPARRTDARFRVLFAGNMGRAQALGSVLEAAALLQNAAPDVEFVFLGGGVEVDALKALAAAKALGNVKFLPAVPPRDVGPHLVDADLLLVHLRRDPLFAVTIPSKTQAYMAAGRPILMCVEGDAAALVEAAGCGAVVEPENPRAIADAIRSLRDAGPEARHAMAAAGREFYQRNLSMRAGVDRFATLFAEVVGQAREATRGRR